MDVHDPHMMREQRRLGDLASMIALPGAIIGVAGLGAAMAIGAARGGETFARFLQGYHIAFLFFIAMSLGALFFVLIHHATQAGWSVTTRRIAEAMAANLSWMWILFIPLVFWGLFGFHEDIRLWHWADAEARSQDALLRHKEVYLNPVFFLVRAAVYFAVWALLSQYYFRMSVRQDSTGDLDLSRSMKKWSYPGLIVFALTLTFAAFDWLMSLDPHWFSTIFGVYFFAGSAAAFFAALGVIVVLLHASGRLTRSITVEHMHDIGKLLFAFGTVFWAYIAFSQYMLIWYANLPEETNWFLPRATGVPVSPEEASALGYVPGAWNWWSAFLLIGHFAVPFLALISRVPKRRSLTLALGCAWMLVMAWFDVFWIAMPVFHPELPRDDGFTIHVLDVVSLAGVAGLYVAATAWRLRGRSLVPERDPRLVESLAFENM
jgi:hypothetical protein